MDIILGNMPRLGHIFIILMLSLVYSSIGLAGNLSEADSEVVGTVTDGEPSWYAIVKIDDRKRKLLTKGDIFCSDADITQCLRILDIKIDSLILKDIKSKDTITIKRGERIPLEGTEIIFEKTVETAIIEYRYKDSKRPGDFTVRDMDRKKLVLQKDYDKSALLKELSHEEKEIFSSPQTEDIDGERIKSSLFEVIEISKVGDDVWSLDRKSAEKTISNAGQTLISVIRKAEPRFRFGEGPSLKFNCELGDVVLNRQGFLIKNLAVAGLVERTGIRQGDLIRHINGQPVNSLFGIYRAYMDVKSNPDIKVVSVDIVRDGRPKTLIYKVR